MLLLEYVHFCRDRVVGSCKRHMVKGHAIWRATSQLGHDEYEGVILLVHKQLWTMLPVVKNVAVPWTLGIFDYFASESNHVFHNFTITRLCSSVTTNLQTYVTYRTVCESDNIVPDFRCNSSMGWSLQGISDAFQRDTTPVTGEEIDP